MWAVLMVTGVLVLGRTKAFSQIVPKIRTYNIAAVEEDWNYSPSGWVPEHTSSRNPELPVLGYVYKKGLFREYEDTSFSTRKSRAPWMGILGPVIQAEVGDTIIVNFFNNGSHPVSVHPHGVFYEKKYEGAHYQDKSHSRDRQDDRVPPGGSYRYIWQVKEEDGPTPNDPDCLTWAYHSHSQGDTDIHTGFIGPLIICRPGSLTPEGGQIDVAHSFMLFVMSFDETRSWYFNENLARVSPDLSDEQIQKILESQEFQEHNQMSSINGVLKSLPGISSCLNDRISWHLIGMGDEIDLNSITFEGHLLTVKGHRTDVITLTAGEFATGYMVAKKVGNWTIQSEVGDHSENGMEATLSITDCNEQEQVSSRGQPIQGRVREYFIAAVELKWNYGPSGTNMFNNKSLEEDSDAEVFFTRGPDRIGGVYKKVVYQEYTDASFDIIKPRSSELVHLGLLGPPVKGEVGDTIKINFHNKASRPYSLHTTAFDDKGGDSPGVIPGQTEVYHWYISEDEGPTSLDPPCLTWRYYSEVDFIKAAYGGLHGILLTCRPGTLDANGRQINVQKEFFLLFAVMDENQSPYLRENVDTYCLNPDGVDLDNPDEDFEESNKMHSINGLMYGNLRGLTMHQHDNVSWHVIAIGSEVDLHTAYFQGQTFQQHGLFRDSVHLLPSSHHTLIMKADNPGNWELSCRTNDHFTGGMRAMFQVLPSDDYVQRELRDQTKVREYFIAAVEEEWDYAPTDRHIITGQSLQEHESSKVYVTRDETHIGSRYKKALFREYVDNEFTHRKPSRSDSEHLAILGPLIKAEVGDTIKVVFKNMASRPYNIHPHGVIEISSSPNLVQPNSTVEYLWFVPERAGPGPSGFNCTTWAYYSSVELVQDTNTGLVGPLVTCREGVLLDSGTRSDVDREFALLFTVFDENVSWYLDDNIATYCLNPEAVDKEDEDFQESNKKHAINGRVFGTLTGLEGNLGDRVTWYMIGMGNEIDIHSAHFHGLTFVDHDDGGHRDDVVDLFPGVFRTAEMELDSNGTWLLHCHVDEHLTAGMSAVVTVHGE